MKFKFPSRDNCESASNELSRFFSGNGYHYDTDIFDWKIKLLNECPDLQKAREICQKHGGSPC